MKMTGKVAVAALVVALCAGSAEARKPGGGGGTPTNYGCNTLRAGSTVYNSTTKKTLLVSTYACYLCNMTTRVCAIQSPSSLVGWYFNLP